MRYKCLVFDHDDTVVNSTATIHHPCFQQYLALHYPGRSCTLEHYFLKNFDPGFIPMCREEYGMSDEDLEEEGCFWGEYVKDHIPVAYEGIRAIMERHRAEGGLLCVVSHSFEENILRDYAANGLPEPDAVYGWSRPIHERKPAPFPLEDIVDVFVVFQDLPGRIGYFRAADEDFRVREDLFHQVDEVAGHVDIPDVAGKADGISPKRRDVAQDVIDILIDRVFSHSHVDALVFVGRR